MQRRDKMQLNTLTEDELEYVGKPEETETSHGIPIDPPKKKGLPRRGTFLVMDGMPMIVLSKSDKCRTLHLKWLTDAEIAKMVKKQQKWTDEELAEMAKE